MQEYLYLLTIILPLATILIVFGMKYVSAAVQARARATGDAAHRELAQQAVAVQSTSAGALTAIQNELAQIGTRLAAVEKILKAVE